MSPRRGKPGAPGAFAFLRDRDAFVRRFVLAEVLAEPRGKVVRLPRGRRAAAPGAPTKPDPEPR